MKFLLLILVVLVAVAVPVVLVSGAGGELVWLARPGVVGPETGFAVRATAKSGIKQYRAALEQGGKRWVLAEQGSGFSLFSPAKSIGGEISFNASISKIPGAVDGPARVTVEAQTAQVLSRTLRSQADVRIALQPASLVVPSSPHDVSFAGPGIVAYTVRGDWVETGVRFGDHRFRAHALPGGSAAPGQESRMFSFFVMPWDSVQGQSPLVYAISSSGREVSVPLNVWRAPGAARERNLTLSESFLRRAIAEISGYSGGDVVPQFVNINSSIRAQNLERVRKLHEQSESRLLWTGAFLQLAKSSVEGRFADIRNYYVNGTRIDRQVHLGLDVASTRNAPVQAANSGKVVLAERLGIFGNCVVVDHGYGLQTLYGHLSSIDVAPGATVKKGESLGLTGMSGLAGGDHLHFAMLIDGVDVNPVRFFEPNWIRKTIVPVLPVPGL